MNKYGVKAAACALVSTLSLSGYQMTLEAKIQNSSDVPAAGVAVVLDEGSTIQDLQVEVVQNIAYLESASGLQPNIIKASEKVALADTLNNAVNTKTATSKISSEFTEGLSESISEAASEILTGGDEEQQEKEAELSTELWSEWEISGEVSTEDSTLTQETAEEESITEESSERETSSQETGDAETTETAEVEATETETTEATTETETTEDASDADDSSEETDDFQSSAGFSATDTYDDVEVTEETETEEDSQDFSGLVIAQVTNYVNVRSTPSEDGEVVGKLYDKSVGEFIEEKDGWYKIVSGNCTGYVKGEFCAAGEQAEELAKEVGTTYAVVNTTTLKVRQDASTESAVLGLVPINEELVVLEELDGWVKIAIEEGDGYVSKDYINLRTDFVHAESREEEEVRLAKEARAREEARAATEAARVQRQAEAQAQRSEANQATIESARNIAASSQGSEMGKSVIDYATQFVGNPYVWGGSSLTNGTDCSGFVMSVYNNFGVSLPHSSSALRSQGYDVGGLSNAQPGDIVCYSGHVGLYVGNGQIVHASTSKTGIIVSSATYRNVLSVRRIF